MIKKINTRNLAEGLRYLEIEGHIFYKVPQFKYFWVFLTQGNELKMKISKKIKMANKCKWIKESF